MHSNLSRTLGRQFELKSFTRAISSFPGAWGCRWRALRMLLVPCGAFGARFGWLWSALGLPKVPLHGITLKGFPGDFVFGCQGGAFGVLSECFWCLGGALRVRCLWNALGVPKVHLNGLSRKGSPILLGPSRSAQQLFDYFGRVNVDPTHPTVHCQPARF